MGGHLATITSPDEQRFLKRLNKSSKTLWIGLRRGNDDTWNWVTGEPLVITVWNEGEPNNPSIRTLQRLAAGMGMSIQLKFIPNGNV